MLNKNKTPDQINREIVAKLKTFIPKGGTLRDYFVLNETKYGRIVFTYNYKGDVFRADIPRHSDYTFGAKKGE